MLGISIVEFYDLSPKEFHHAVKAVGEVRTMQMRHDWEIARYTTVSIINYTSTILKHRITDEKKFFPLPWDSESPGTPEAPQTQEQLKRSVLAIASAFGAKKGTRMPNDPPTLLVKKKR